jgi:hypothetical protein
LLLSQLVKALPGLVQLGMRRITILRHELHLTRLIANSSVTSQEL